MKGAVAFVVLLAVTAAAAAFVVPEVISAQSAKAKLAERLSFWGAGRVLLQGKAEISVLPWPSIAVRDVIVRGGRGAEDPPLLTIGSMKVSLRLLPLLTGRLEPEALTLVEPRMRLVHGDGETETWKARGFAALGALLSDAGEGRPTGVVIRDGTLAYRSRGNGRVEEIAAVNLQFAWQGPGRPAALFGSFECDERLVEFDAALNQPRAVASEAGGKVRLALRAPRTETSESEEDDEDFRGMSRHVEHSSLTCGRVVRGMALAANGSFDVKGTIRAGEGEFSLSDATLALGDISATGGAMLRLGSRRPMVRVSLAFDDLRLGQVVRDSLPEDLAYLLAVPVPVGWLDYADGELRASANEVELGGPRLGKAVLKASVRGGRMRLHLEESALAGGRVSGQLTVGPAGNGARIGLTGRVDDVSVGYAGSALLAKFANPLIGAATPPQGTASLSFDLSARGGTVGSMVERLAGWAAIDVRDGSATGTDLVSTLEGLARGNSPVDKGKAFMPAAGRTSFSQLTAHITFQAGVARAERIRMAGKRYRVVLSGEGDLVRGEIEATGTASLYSEPSESNGDSMKVLVEWPFGVGGTFRDPMIAPGIPKVERRLQDAAIRPSGTVARRGTERLWRTIAREVRAASCFRFDHERRSRDARGAGRSCEWGNSAIPSVHRTADSSR